MNLINEQETQEFKEWFEAMNAKQTQLMLDKFDELIRKLRVIANQTVQKDG